MARALLQCGLGLLLVHLLEVTSANPTRKHSSYLPETCLMDSQDDLQFISPPIWYSVFKSTKTDGELTECARDEGNSPVCKCTLSKAKRSKDSEPKPFTDCPFDYPHGMLTCPFFVVPFVVTVVSVLWLVRKLEAKAKAQTQSA
ncbi:PREDICTED: receptor activity-modifying protein 1-like [Elephantulus edwardii]|uniref:receptor activity-modifying protein 1-like n=1 Tax=Elephantulus edwardii TaxID=28737 RepID=UPI0003F09961|nr:PREDICTED: receptor activity-modifying protein 1-like [Elephantulus edwardii]